MAPKITILTASHLCRNPRVVKEARTLAAAGYTVTVAILSLSTRFEAMDRELMATQPFHRLTLDLTPDNPASRRRRFAARAATWLGRQALRLLRFETAATLGPVTEFLAFARRTTGDLLITHNELSLWAGLRLMAEGYRVAVDMEDWYSEDLLPADRRTRPLRLLRATERRMLNGAVYTTVPSDSMADALSESYHCPRPLPIRNTFPLPPDSRADRPERVGPVSFVWFSQTIGPGRGLEEFVAAWRTMSVPTFLRLRGDIRPGYRESLSHALTSAQRERLQFLPLVSPEELVRDLPNHDIGLALEASLSRSRDLTITNKIFQYLGAGLAVVATDTTGQREVMRTAVDSGLVVRIADTATFSRQLDSLVGDPLRLRTCQRAARTAATRAFNWESDAVRLLGAVSKALAPADHHVGA